MRVNVYTEELDGVEIVTKGKFHGLRFRLKSAKELHKTADDDDSSAVTLWGLSHVRNLLTEALDMLAKH